MLLNALLSNLQVLIHTRDGMTYLLRGDRGSAHAPAHATVKLYDYRSFVFT